MRILLHWLINAAALFLLPYVFRWVQVESVTAALIAALVLGLVNALVRPVLFLLTLPVTLLTLGLFIFVLNGLLFWAVGRASGIALADDFVAKQLAFGDTLPYEMRASMLHDLVAGNRLEAPWLCGAVVRLGQEAGVPTPVNATVYAALLPYVNGTPQRSA